MAFGEPLPQRVSRGIVLARLANMLDGHAATPQASRRRSPRCSIRTRFPTVPRRATAALGEILALGSLFRELASASNSATRSGWR